MLIFCLSCRKSGRPDNDSTYTMVSALWASAFALGAALGPCVSGALYDWIGFSYSTIFIFALEGIAVS